MQDLGKHDPLRRWPEETRGLEQAELVKLGTALLQQAVDTPTPWSDVATGDLDPSAWLLQGDILQSIRIPIFEDLHKLDSDGYAEVPLDSGTLIVMTQSCDLENRKAPMVACCPVHTLDDFESVNPTFKKKGQWGECPAWQNHEPSFVARWPTPNDNRKCLLVDFRVIHSLPFDYVLDFIKAEPTHPRLRSPYLEHLSQSFARVFMRVGLPTNIPKFDR